MNHLILVDGNNLGFAFMANPRLSAGEKDTQSTFNTVKKIRALFMNNPDALIMMLWDGRSWRKDVLTDYKENRERTEKQVTNRKAYYDQKNNTVKALQLLGVTQCKADNMEADDLAQIYARKWKGDKVTLLSGDKDWLQLVNERTTWVDPILDRQCTHRNFEAFTGCKDTQQFLEQKYLLGDTGDNIKGLKGVGPVTVNKLFGIWDSVYEFLNDEERWDKWHDAYGQHIPKQLDINELDVYDLLSRNETLMSLHTTSRPEPKNMVQDRQHLDSESFKAFCYENAFLSFLKDYDKFLLPFRENKYVRIRQTSTFT